VNKILSKLLSEKRLLALKTELNFQF